MLTKLRSKSSVHMSYQKHRGNDYNRDDDGGGLPIHAATIAMVTE